MSVIDWKNTWVGPLYMQARVLRVFRYHAPWDMPEGVRTASLPEGIERMSKPDRKAARDDVAAKNMVIYYRAIVARHAPYYYHALTDSYITLFSILAYWCITSMEWDVLYTTS